MRLYDRRSAIVLLMFHDVLGKMFLVDGRASAVTAPYGAADKYKIIIEDE